MNEIIDSLIAYGYIILFFYSLGGGFFALAAAGVLSSLGKMDLYTSIAVAGIANFIGDQALLLFARSNKAQVIEYLKKHRRKLAYSHILMKKYGVWVIFLQKYIYGVKTLVPIAIGLTKYNAIKFAIYNFIASIIWAVVIGVVSYLGGKTILSILNDIKENSWVMPLIGISIVMILYFLINKASKK